MHTYTLLLNHIQPVFECNKENENYTDKCKVTADEILSITDKDAEHKGDFVYLDNKCGGQDD